MWYRQIEWLDAIEAAERLAGMPGLCVLDSAMSHPDLGRYSYVAADPFGIFTVCDGVAHWNEEAHPGAPLEVLAKRMAQYRTETIENLPPFQGGAIGAISYDFGWHLDAGPSSPISHSAGQTVYLAFHDVVLALDHVEQRCFLVASGYPAASPGRRRVRAEERLAAFERELKKICPRFPVRYSGANSWTSDFTLESYSAAVERVRNYIRAGDVYQVNISQRFSVSLAQDFDAWQLYKRLRVMNPAPFAAYLRLGSQTILSSSPERFLRTQGRGVEMRPIKGTAPRAADQTQDRASARALLASRKDRAENIMIVDLLRSDLARVSEPASVEVPVLCGLETYEGVHHLVSVVTGSLAERYSALDVLAATFPGGSITGAPKIRAMEIIAEIEGKPRGIYCGAIGTMSFDGAIDLSIAIRTILIEDGQAVLQAGGGITILSDPAREYEETLTKVQRIFDAFAAHKIDTVG